jgi:hypothetical protein
MLGVNVCTTMHIHEKYYVQFWLRGAVRPVID